MLELLKGVLKAKVDVILVLVGSSMLLLGIFEWNGQLNNIIIRTHPHSFVIFIGILLTLIGISLYIINFYIQQRVHSEMASPKRDYEEQLVLSYHNLTLTQMLIVQFIYQHLLNEISLEVLFDGFQAWRPGIIQNKNEFYYRIKDLKYNGFINLHNIGRNIAVIEKIGFVQLTLEKKNILCS